MRQSAYRRAVAPPWWSGCWILLALGVSPAASSGQTLEIDPPSPAEIAAEADRALEAYLVEEGADPAPQCDDATYLRRVWLDVAGEIPPPEAVLAFAFDRSPDKRSRVVRELLDDSRYGLNWARYWRDVMLSRRIEDRALLASAALEADLASWLNANDPWDAIATRFITAQGDVRESGATALAFAQEGRTEEIAAETSRIFLGMQIQCAQCHDHPYDAWKRDQFHEFAAFFPRVGVRPVRTETRRSFEVFASDRPALRLRQDDGRRPSPEHFMPDLEDPTAAGTRMSPRFFLTNSELPAGSPDAVRRRTLAEWLTGNPWFSTALVNRLWSELTGEGFYEPVDDLGPEREPRAAEALEVLATAFEANHYDVKWLMETICATQAYQREARPRREADAPPFAANVVQPLRGDQLYNALLAALEIREAPPGRLTQGPAPRRGGPRRQFVETFGYDPSDPRETIANSIPQALAMMNSPQLQAALTASPRTMLGRLLQASDAPEPMIVELYVRLLSRAPSAEELSTGRAALEQAGAPAEGLEDLAWALINSAEFRHRH